MVGGEVRPVFVENGALVGIGLEPVIAKDIVGRKPECRGAGHSIRQDELSGVGLVPGAADEHSLAALGGRLLVGSNFCRAGPRPP